MIIQYFDNKVPYLDLGEKVLFYLETDELSDENYVKKAFEELRETPELMQKSLAELKEFIKCL
jgi:hypothetical protein